MSLIPDPLAATDVAASTETPSKPERAPTRRRLPVATISEFDGVRFLHLGNTPWVQGAMRLRKTRVLELEYVRRMMAWLLLHEPARWTDLHVVHLGLGAATLTRYCHSELKAIVTAVELNPQVIAAGYQWFRLPGNDERLNVIEADAGAWVADADNHATAEVLSVDLYDHQAAAPVLDDDAFYAQCHEVLTPGGVLVVNLFGRNASFARSAHRIEAAFRPEGGQVWMIEPTDEGNTVLLAIRANCLPEAQVLSQRAAAIEARTGLKANEWLGLLKPIPSPKSVAKPARAKRAAKAASASAATDPNAAGA